MILYVEISRVRLSVGRCSFTEATDNALLVTVRASDVVHLRAEHIDLNMYQSSIFLGLCSHACCMERTTRYSALAPGEISRNYVRCGAHGATESATHEQRELYGHGYILWLS